jgi:hypothetical protein
MLNLVPEMIQDLNTSQYLDFYREGRMISDNSIE